MIFRTSMELSDQVAQALSDAGMPDYDSILNCRAGRVVSREGKRLVRRLTLTIGVDPRVCYLKQIAFESPGNVRKNIRKGAGRHTGAYFEHLQINRHKQLGLPVMDSWGWGERSLLGWPVSGFILLPEVPGQRLDSSIARAVAAEREALLSRFGALLRRLHDSGKDSVTRLQDAICTPDGELILIDREHGHLHTTEIDEQASALLCAKTYLKAKQDHAALGIRSRDLEVLMRAYCLEAGKADSSTAMYAATLEQARKLVAEGGKYRGLDVD